MAAFWKIPFGWFALVSFALALGLAPGSSVAKTYVDPSTCGGVGQKPCELSAAKNLGLVYPAKPHPRSFVDGRLDDLSKGPEFWRCPDSHPNRTIFNVTSGNACESSIPLIAGAGQPFRDPNGNYYQCPSSYKHRTIYSVTGKCACGRNAVELPCGWGGKYASAKKLGKLFSSATYLGKASPNPRPAGAFVDPRLDKDFNPFNTANDEYWRCPNGFWRNFNPVTSAAACTINIGQNCDSGNIAAGTPWGGYYCAKKNDCGSKGERPCQIVERIPSCNGSLAEDFIDHKCIDPKIAACLTVTRMAWLARKGSEAAGGPAEQISKAVETAVKDVIETVVPAPVRDTITKGADLVNAEIDKAKATLEAEADALLEELGEGPELSRFIDTVHGRKDRFLDFFSDTGTCYIKEDQLVDEVVDLLGYRPGSITKADLDRDPDLLRQLFALAVPEAQAQLIDGTSYWTLGVEFGVNFFAGLSVASYLAIDFENGEIGHFFGFGPSLTSEKSASVSLVPGFKRAKDMADIGGWSGAIGISARKDSRKLKADYAGTLGMDMTFPDLKDGVRLDGFTVPLSIKVATGAPIEIGGVYAHDWMIWKAGGGASSQTETSDNPLSKATYDVPKPSPSKAEFISLRTHHDTYLTATTKSAATDPHTFDKERFSLVPQGGGKVALYNHAFHVYLGMPEDGSPFHAKEVGDWETFDLIKNDDGSISFKSHWGTYLGAHENGSWFLADKIGSWERFRRGAHPSLGHYQIDTYHGEKWSSDRYKLIAVGRHYKGPEIGATEHRNVVTFFVTSYGDGTVSIREGWDAFPLKFVTAHKDGGVSMENQLSPLGDRGVAKGVFDDKTQRFELVRNPDGRVAFKTPFDTYIRSWQGGKFDQQAAAKFGDWELYHLVRP